MRSLKEVKEELMRDPEFKKEYERFDLSMKFEKIRINLMIAKGVVKHWIYWRLTILRDTRYVPSLLIRLIDYIRYDIVYPYDERE